MSRKFRGATRVLVGLALSAAGAARLQAQEVAQAGAPTAPRAGSFAALVAARPFPVVRAEYTHSYVHGNAAALAALHSDSSRYVAADGSMAYGRAAIREAYAARVRRALDFSAEAAHVAADTRFVFESGRYEQQLSPTPGEVVTVQGRYIAAWSLRPEGWRLQLLGVSNDSVPAAPVVTRAVAEHYAALRALDAEGWTATFAPDAVLEATGEAAVRGRDALRARMQSLLARAARLDVREEEVIVSGDKAIVQWRATLAGRSGQEVKLGGVDLLHVDADGKIRQLWSYLDPDEMAKVK